MYMLPTRGSLLIETHRLKVKKWKKIFNANGNENKPGIAMLISNKIDFKTNTMKRDKREKRIT